MDPESKLSVLGVRIQKANLGPAAGRPWPSPAPRPPAEQRFGDTVTEPKRVGHTAPERGRQGRCGNIKPARLALPSCGD